MNELHKAIEETLLQVSEEARDYYTRVRKSLITPGLKTVPLLSVHGMSVLQEMIDAGLVHSIAGFIVDTDEGHQALKHYKKTGCPCQYNAYWLSRLDCCGGKATLPEPQSGQNNEPSGLTDTA